MPRKLWQARGCGGAFELADRERMSRVERENERICPDFIKYM